MADTRVVPIAIICRSFLALTLRVREEREREKRELRKREEQELQELREREERELREREERELREREERDWRNSRMGGIAGGQE